MSSELRESILPPSVGEFPKQTSSPLAVEIGWSHNYVIIEKCKNPQQRLFYIKTTKRFGWSKSIVCYNQIKDGVYIVGEAETTHKDQRQRLIGSFVKLVYLYESKMIMLFNHKDGQKTITFAGIKGSDLIV